jgi:hypothetical protein
MERSSHPSTTCLGITTSGSRPNGRRTQKKLAFLGVGALGALVLAGGALAYNEGLIGPGHCSLDSIASSAPTY